MILTQIDDTDSIFTFLIFFINTNAGFLFTSAQFGDRIVGMAKMDRCAKGMYMFLTMSVTFFLISFESMVIGGTIMSIIAIIERTFFFMFGLLMGYRLLMGEGMVRLRVINEFYFVVDHRYSINFYLVFILFKILYEKPIEKGKNTCITKKIFRAR